MSGNVGKTVKEDKRVVRTRGILGDALVALIQEKLFEDITVQEVLDRAGVARSTFYTHYRDKDDLLLSDVEDFLKMFSTLLTIRHASPQRIAPVAEFFTHISESRELVAALVEAGKMQDIKTLGTGIFARSIDARLRLAGIASNPAQLAAQAHALAGSFFALLDWWIDHDMKADPQEMDALFHRMAWSGLAP